MKTKIKTCYFQIDGPIRQSHVKRGQGYPKVSTLLEYPDYLLQATPNEVVELPCVHFQAKMTFVRTSLRRIVMKDRFGMEWFVYSSGMDHLVPVMVKGVIECWWKIVKRGGVYGLPADVATPLGPVGPNQDVPHMLDSAKDLRMLEPHFLALAA